MKETQKGDNISKTKQPIRNDNEAGQAAPPSPETTTVYIKTTDQGRLPVYATSGSAGCDLYLARDLVLLPGQRMVLPVNFSLALEPGVEAQVRPRSGLSLKTTLRVPNSPGTIDCDYRDPVGVIAENTASLFSILDDLMLKPSLLSQLAASYNPTTYGAFLSQKAKDELIAAETAGEAADWLPQTLASLPVFIDSQGNPYGTLYLKSGERIAQMVLSRYLRAAFISHDNPAAIGYNRGGGFGSTGTDKIK